jgi:hypothetical protein
LDNHFVCLLPNDGIVIGKPDPYQVGKKRLLVASRPAQGGKETLEFIAGG